MQLLTAEIIIFLVTVLDGVQNELNIYGENVCLKSKTIYERTAVKRMKPKEVKMKHRCWDIRKFFKCEKTVVLWNEDLDYDIIPRTKVVASCCDGYKESEGTKCVPDCRLGCINGDCRAPDLCVCHPGFHGFQCEKECPVGFWGAGCIEECKCSNGGVCDRVSGCVCEPGWMGERCQLPCKEGYYGRLCEDKCDCNNKTCDHETGKCPIATAYAATATTNSTTTGIQSAFKTLTSNSAQSLPTSSTEFYQPLEWSTTKDENSVSEIFYIDLDSFTETEKRATEEESAKTTTGKTAKTTAIEVVTEMPVSTEEDLATESETETVPNEKNFQSGLERTNIEERDSIRRIILSVTSTEPNGIKNKTIWINFAVNREDTDRNETDSFIFEGKGSSNKETIFEFLHFLPSLSVLSAFSFLIVIIAARWLIVTHKKKTRMLVVVTEKGSIFQSEEGVRVQAENFLWVNNCKINPVYLSDVDLNSTTPVLETFKPLDKAVSEKERTAL